VDILINTKISIRGNKVGIRCKIAPEAYVLEYEYNRIRYIQFEHFFQCERQKQELFFSGDGKQSVRQMMQYGMSYVQFNRLVQQILKIWSFTEQNYYRFNQIIFHPDFVFYDSASEVYRVIYYPLCGEVCEFDVGLFLLDVIGATDMSAALKQKWITVVAKAAYLDANPNWGSVLGSMLEEKRVSSQYANENDEAPTGFDDEAPTGFESFGTGDMNEEMPTGFDFASEEEDGEAPTGFSDDEELTSFDDSGMTSEIPNGCKEPYVVRRATGERKKVNSPRFVIGRSRQRANFCIENNPKIGNVHAVIIQKGKRFFLMDNESKNGTFVSGNRLSGGATVELYDGLIFQIYNEDFVFHC
jgi:hypothetical protein